MSNLISYKGYHATINFDSEDNILVGKVCWISDSLTFEGETIEEIVSAFHDTIDDYLAFCQENGKEPCKEFKGTFNIRIAPDLHRAAAICAAEENITLNQFVSRAIESQVYADSAHRIATEVVRALAAQSYTVVKESKMIYNTGKQNILTSRSTRIFH